ncbi:DUF7832 domain-containing protein [Caulobacter sp. LARHSG274]
MTDSVLYDKADWHSGGDFPDDLPPVAGGTHIGMFFAWAAIHDLAGELHREDFPEGLASLIDRRVTPAQACEELLDGKFHDEDLSPEGNAFAQAYYNAKGYYRDLGAVSTALELASVYHIPDSWVSYDLIAPYIDKQFKKWKRPGLLGRLFER